MLPMKPTQGYTVNKLAELLEMDRRSLTRLLVDVEPDEENGKHKLYKLSTLWELKIGKSANAEKARLDKLRADVVELDLAQKKGELVPTDTILDLLIPLFSNVRTKFIAIPAKAAPLLTGQSTELEVQDTLKRLVNDCLEELSNTDALALLGDKSAKITQAAAKLNSK